MTELSKDTIKQIAEAAGREAAKKVQKDMFVMIGVDVSTPEKMIETQHDMQWLRKARTGEDQIRKWAKRSAVGIAVGGILYAVWSELVEFLRLGPS